MFPVEKRIACIGLLLVLWIKFVRPVYCNFLSLVLKVQTSSRKTSSFVYLLHFDSVNLSQFSYQVGGSFQVFKLAFIATFFEFLVQVYILSVKLDLRSKPLVNTKPSIVWLLCSQTLSKWQTRKSFLIIVNFFFLRQVLNQDDVSYKDMVKITSFVSKSETVYSDDETPELSYKEQALLAAKYRVRKKLQLE